MTWATLAASGRGRLVLWLEVAGCPSVFATDNLTPRAGVGSSRDGGATNWYHDHGFTGVLPVMAWSGVTISERASFIEGTLSVEPIQVTLVDHRQVVTSLLRAWTARSMTRLVSTLSRTEVAAAVVDLETAFPAGGGVFWVGEEAIAYDHTDPAGEFHVLTRGCYGTIAREHRVDLDQRPVPLAPAVLDGLQSLTGRRCYLHAATVSDQGVVSYSTCIYRGHIRPGCEPAEGAYPLTIDHISTYFSRSVCSRDVASTLWPGYWYSGDVSDASLSSIRVVQVLDAGGGETPTETYITVTGAWYASPQDLKLAISTAIATTLGAWMRYPAIYFGPGSDHVGMTIYSDALGGDYRFGLWVREGDPLWALGFDPGFYGADAGSDPEFVAQKAPRAFVCELPLTGWTLSVPMIYCDDASRFPEDSFVIFGGKAPWLEVGPGGGVGTSLPLSGQCDGWFFDGSARHHGRFVAVEGETDLQVRSVFAPGYGNPRDWIEACFGLEATDTTPQDLIVTGLEADDFDWTELADAIIGIDPRLVAFSDCVTKSALVSALVCDRLGILGIVPRLTTRGRIGFVRLRTPCEVDASSVELDDSVWSVVEAAKVRTILEGEPLLNQIVVEHSFDYVEDRFAPVPSKIHFDDGRGLLGKTWGKTYNARGIHVRPGTSESAYFQSGTDLAESVAGVCLGSHFGLFGRLSPLVDIPCTWVSRRLLLGDVAKLTHPCVIDPTAGMVGTHERLGVVVGRVQQVTDNAPDRLLVLLPSSVAWPISPCCHATAWDPVALELTIAATEFARAGEDDLAYFADGYELRFQTRDSTVDLGVGSATIDVGGVDIPGRTITLVADPFGGAFPAGGVFVFFADYDECAAAQRDWLFNAGTDYTLGAASEDGMRWGA